MNLKGAFARYSIILTILLTLLSACGGGSSDEVVQKVAELTYQPLANTMKVNEGETVNLTLGLTGEGAKEVKFDWQVEGDIPFSGQGSDSISFVAPEVDTIRSIRVEVKLADSNSRTIGFSSQSIFLTVQNIEKITDPVNNGEESDISVVTALNFNELNDGSTWFHETTQFTSTLKEDGTTTTIETQQLSLVHIETVNVSTETVTLSECGLSGTVDLVVPSYREANDCGDLQSSLTIGQSEGKFRLERMCGENLVAASTYTKKSDSRSSSNGELNIDFSTYDDLDKTSDVCGIVTTADVKSFDTDGTLSETANATVLRLFTEYQGNPFELQFQINRFPTAGFASLYTGFSSDNFAKIFTDVLPDIANLSESKYGSIRFDFDNDKTNIKADFDFSLTSRAGPGESIEGELTLVFE
jgi:hypothetical protein